MPISVVAMCHKPSAHRSCRASRCGHCCPGTDLEIDIERRREPPTACIREIDGHRPANCAVGTRPASTRFRALLRCQKEVPAERAIYRRTAKIRAADADRIEVDAVWYRTTSPRPIRQHDAHVLPRSDGCSVRRDRPRVRVCGRTGLWGGERTSATEQRREEERQHSAHGLGPAHDNRLGRAIAQRRPPRRLGRRRSMGYRYGAIELYLSPSDQDETIYVVSPTDVERWPRSDPMTLCA